MACKGSFQPELFHDSVTLQELRPLSQLVHGAEPGYFCILALQVTLQGLFVPAGIVFAKIK